MAISPRFVAGAIHTDWNAVSSASQGRVRVVEVIAPDGRFVGAFPVSTSRLELRALVQEVVAAWDVGDYAKSSALVRTAGAINALAVSLPHSDRCGGARVFGPCSKTAYGVTVGLT